VNDKVRELAIGESSSIEPAELPAGSMFDTAELRRYFAPLAAFATSDSLTGPPLLPQALRM
jgi:hypothetical protein